MRSSRVFWAILLVLMGVLLLANNLELLSFNAWDLFWPLFLILLGAWFLAGNLIKGESVPLEEASIPLDDAQEARIVVKHGAGRLHVDSSADPGTLVSGSFTNGLDMDVKTLGSQLDVVMRPGREGWMFPWNWVSGQGLRWDLGFTTVIPLDLTFETGAAETRLNLELLQVRNLTLKTGASSTEITLPARAGMTQVKIEAGAAAVNIRVPEGVAARVEAEAGLASVDVDASRFPGEGKYFQSSNYDSAENKVHIRVETGLGSIQIR